MSAIKPWIEVVTLHQDVLAEGFSEDIFALDLGPLADGNPHVPSVYRDAEQFFRASYLTKGLRSLLADVLYRLAAGAGNRILKLVTPFGGGKSHTLAAVFHAARNRKALDTIPEGQGLAVPKNVRTAVFDGQFFDATNGKEVTGGEFRTRTLWGWIAWSLRGKEGYDILREQDEARVAPGGDEILKVLDQGPNLILLDEVLQYLISAGGIKIQQTTLRDETLTFIQRLTVAVGNTSNSVLVFSLQSSKRESLDYINLFQTVDHMAARKDQLREPVEGSEVLKVIQRRLLAKLPDEAETTPTANAYQDVVTQMRRAYAKTTAEQQQAEQEGLELRDRIRSAHPFHPALIDLMRERWAAIPDFQRTRGALRFLAACLRSVHKTGASRAVLGPGDVPIHDPSVRLAFFKEVGQQADFQAVLEHDLLGVNARARRIDERRAKEFPSEALKRPAVRIATTILMYSFGGLQREGSQEAEVLPPGVTEPELLSVCVSPDLDSTTIQACLKELREQCLYLHFDGVRYCFKKDPNVTLLIEQEADIVSRDDTLVRNRIKEMLEERLAGHKVEIWPEKPGDIPDKEAAFLVGYISLEFAHQPKSKKQTISKEFFEKYGEKPRQYRNGLGLAVPSADQVEILRRAVRYLLAIGRIKKRPKDFHLTEPQKAQLREREATEEATAESALLHLYKEVCLPKLDNSEIVVDSVALGGRPLQITLNEKKQALIHERITELLTHVHTRVFDRLNPNKLIELFKLGDGNPPKMGIRVSDLVDGFYSFLGFTRISSAQVIRQAIVKGIAEGRFGYYNGSEPTLGEDGEYQISPSKARFEVQIAEDEIDLTSGFIMMPQAIPQEKPVPDIKDEKKPGNGDDTSPSDDGEETPGDTTGGKSGSGTIAQTTEKVVDLSFNADRNQLFTAWNALANLTDMAGTVRVQVRAERAEGFDKNKLQNGVLEPLREADLIE